MTGTEASSGVKWVAVLTILVPAVGVLSGLAALTLRIAQTPHLTFAPQWLVPYLIPALLAIDTVLAIGVVTLGIAILSMRTE